MARYISRSNVIYTHFTSNGQIDGPVASREKTVRRNNISVCEFFRRFLSIVK